MVYTNKYDLSVPMQVMLVDDAYDYDNDPMYLSATTLLKPIKQIVLAKRLPPNISTDLADRIPMVYGTALHSAVEAAWVLRLEDNLKKLGLPNCIRKRIKVNPTIDQLTPDCIPVYLERRTKKPFRIDGETVTIGGQFDFVYDGQLYDHKSTSVYTYIHGSHDKDYALQGSIYRWLNPDIITENTVNIDFIFTDWSAKDVYKEGYPQCRIVTKSIPLLSPVETTTYITKKVKQFLDYRHALEEDIPECTDEELWRSDTVYKYYADPKKVGGRSTKNFATILEANQYKLSKKGKGVVIPVVGEPRRCLYCSASPICQQRRKYFPDEADLPKV